MNQFISKISQRKKEFVIAIGLIAAVLAGTVLINGNNVSSSVMRGIDTSTYQAVHLDTNKTYFGRVTKANEESVIIEDVFYFLDDSKKKLVKRGEEAQSGNDSLMLNRNHVLATENLSQDSTVVKAILKYRKNKN